MTKKSPRLTLPGAVLAVLIFSASVIGPAAAAAQGGSRVLPERTGEDSVAAQKIGQRGKLDSKRLKACQVREAQIDKILARLSANGEKKLAKITRASERIQKIYSDNSLNAANYQELLSAVNAKKAAADAAVAALRSSAAGFNCAGADPLGAGLIFKDKLKNQNTALREYKAAVKELAKTVKAAAQSERSQ